MSRINQKPAVADLHRQQILKAAEVLFTEKGYEHTRIEDISRASGYSRRTLYAYYQSKEDILCHIVEKGLLLLKQELESALEQPGNFMDRYRAVCMALWNYQQSCPHSLEQVNRAKAGELETGGPLPVIGRILNLGTEVNRLMAGFLQKGKDEGAVRPDDTVEQSDRTVHTGADKGSVSHPAVCPFTGGFSGIRLPADCRIHSERGGDWVREERWLLCPLCGGKTRSRVRADTILFRYPLYCPKCRRETLVQVQQFHMTVLKEPDAKTQC